MDEGSWRDLIRSGQPPFWRLLAEGSGGCVRDWGATMAAIVPVAPHRSVFNSVFYEDADELLANLDAIDAAYLDAGVSAWTVWVPERDAGVARALEAAGHRLDAEPREMGVELSAIRPAEPDPELEIREERDLTAMARINEVAYGHAEGDFVAVERAVIPGMRVYLGALGGDVVGTMGIWAHGSDAVVVWVAVLPEARGRGISGRMMTAALADAREAGLETTTLQASPLGLPVYEKLGYRDYGAVQMWERRR